MNDESLELANISWFGCICLVFVLVIVIILLSPFMLVKKIYEILVK